MKTISTAFFFLYMLALTYNADAACHMSATANCESGEGTRTSLDFKNGKISCVDSKCNVAIQTANLISDPNNEIKYTNTYQEMDATGGTPQQKKTVGILNMYNKWISGKSYIESNGIKFKVDLKDTISITRYLTQQQLKPKKKPDEELSKEEKEELGKINDKINNNLLSLNESSKIDEFVSKVKGAVQDLDAKDEASAKGFIDDKKTISTETDFNNMLKGLEVQANSPSTLSTCVVDNQPFACTVTMGKGIHDPAQPDPKIAAGDTSIIKTPNGNLYCSGMIQNNEWPLTARTMQADFNYTSVNPLALSFAAGDTSSIFIADTGLTNNVCTFNADRIFKASMDTTTR